MLGHGRRLLVSTRGADNASRERWEAQIQFQLNPYWVDVSKSTAPHVSQQHSQQEAHNVSGGTKVFLHLH